MNEILKMLNALSADQLDSVIMRANIILEKKRKEEAEAALREKERQRQEKIAQEKRRQEEIAELQRKLQELQQQKVDIPEERHVTAGDGFIMYDAQKPTGDAASTAARGSSARPQTVSKIACPHCHTMNTANSLFCESCGQKLSAPKSPSQAASKPSQIYCPYCRQLNSSDSLFCLNCGKKLDGTRSQRVTQPTSRKVGAQVRYADESLKKWEMYPGESVQYHNLEIIMLQPNGGKYAYYMDVTNERILLSREGATAKNATLAVRMGGGLVGSLIAEGVKAASGAGPKPWLEIPLAAVSNCGVQNKKEFFIVADQTYVLKNKGYDKFLPDMVNRAKSRGV